MKSAWTLAFSVLLVILALFAWSGEKDNKPVILSDTKLEPVIDGTISATEYPLSIKLPNGLLALSRNGGLITFGISFKTKGWVAIGFGTRRMDKAHIIISYVKDGKAIIKEQTGVLNRHSDVENLCLIKQAAREVDDSTTLEGELPLAAILGSDANALPVIFAYGSGDNISGVHTYRSLLSIPLQ